jgi:hypothetical protein
MLLFGFGTFLYDAVRRSFFRKGKGFYPAFRLLSLGSGRLQSDLSFSRTLEFPKPAQFLAFRSPLCAPLHYFHSPLLPMLDAAVKL